MENKLDTITNLFEGNEIRSIWNSEKAINYYRKKGCSDNWIEVRLKGILNRKKLTDVWKENGIIENYEYAMLTNEIYEDMMIRKSN